ncbi:sortase domain-containing protein [Saccharothrix sp. Mg75]|uniref:sortase domain-containing protein n=1 Tax=Saccharothrix sp. Mg75 TaxID=3445357 RepID=UPI003EEA211C
MSESNAMLRTLSRSEHRAPARPDRPPSNADTAEVPSLDQPLQAGWYKHGPAPGDTGPTVLLGHGRPGIFHDLAKLNPGDRFEVIHHDDTTATFAISRVDRGPNDHFPTDAVYCETTTPRMRLISCGGAFDPATGDYRDNVIVYADLARKTGGRTPSATGHGHHPRRRAHTGKRSRRG